MTAERRPILGVFGGGGASVPPGSAAFRLAEEVGREVAVAGAILLCGGLGGVMEAAAKGAREAGGHTLGILPLATSQPNPYIEVPVLTGLSHGRNYVNAATADALIALAGEAGTLSEIALGIKCGKTVVCLEAWSFLAAAGYPGLVFATGPAAAVAQALRALGAAPGSRVRAQVSYPDVPGQERNRALVVDAIGRW